MSDIEHKEHNVPDVLDELHDAIEHARDVAENRTDLCDECREEHEKLANWLQELYDIKLNINENLKNNNEKAEAYDQLYQMYVDKNLQLIEYYNLFLLNSIIN